MRKYKISEILMALLLIAGSAVFLYLHPKRDYLLTNEFGLKIFNLSLYNAFCVSLILFFGGFGLNIIDYLKTSRRTTAILLGAWMIGAAIVIKNG